MLCARRPKCSWNTAVVLAVLAFLYALPLSRADAAGGARQDGAAKHSISPADSASVSTSAPLPANVKHVVDIDDIWTGVSPDFDALRIDNHVFVSYYNKKRELSVANVDLSRGEVTVRHLNSIFDGWDSHNAIVLAVDAFGWLHVAGNMHASPLVYGKVPLSDFSQLALENRMVGADESAVTYPAFLNMPDGSLVFRYRSGRSGDGEWYLNAWNGTSWRRLMDAPLFLSSLPGMGTFNAYPSDYIPGPDGWYHMTWTWRTQPDAATNFDIHYAKSRDLVHWSNADGEPIPTPISPKTDTKVVTIPSHGGLLNGMHHLSFDAQGRPVITFTKYDNNPAVPAPDCAVYPADIECGGWSKWKFAVVPGSSQIYVTRFENHAWNTVQITDWRHRWSFGGGGAGFVVDFSFSGLTVKKDGSYVVYVWRKWQDGTRNGYLKLDPTTLQYIGKSSSFPLENQLPSSFRAVGKDKSAYPAFGVRMQFVSEQSGLARRSSKEYFLRWETQAVRCRDNNPALRPEQCDVHHPRPSGEPPPSKLQLFQLTAPLSTQESAP